MKKIHLLLALLAFTAYHSYGQQDALYSQYMFNMMLVNPAYTGSRDLVSLNAMYRKQWLSMDGAPETMTFSADMPLRNERMGTGLVLYNDRLGVISNTGIYGNYAYRVQLSNNATLSMGANLGFTYYHANFSKVKLGEDGRSDEAFSSNYSKILPNLGAGLFYNSDKYYIGLSLPHALNHKLNQAGVHQAHQYRHWFLAGGYVFTLNHHLKLKPSGMVKQVSGAPIQLDVNANLWLYDKYSVGLSYRSLDAPVILLEAQLLEQLRFGYAFDYSHTRLRKYNNGTHEFLLRYEFGYDKGKMITPRYF